MKTLAGRLIQSFPREALNDSVFVIPSVARDLFFLGK